MSAPGSIAVAKLMYPETEKSNFIGVRKFLKVNVNLPNIHPCLSFTEISKKCCQKSIVYNNYIKLVL